MIRRLDAIDAAAHKIDQPIGAVEFPLPIVKCSGIPRHMTPVSGNLWGSAERMTTSAPVPARNFAREMPRKPEPPAITILGVSPIWRSDLIRTSGIRPAASSVESISDLHQRSWVPPAESQAGSRPAFHKRVARCCPCR